MLICRHSTIFLDIYYHNFFKVFIVIAIWLSKQSYKFL